MRQYLTCLGRGTGAPIAAVGLVYLMTLLSFERDGMWTTDNAARFLQVRALLQSGFASFAIPWPGRSIDPEFVYNPLPHVFSSVRGGELYSVFSPVFAMMSAPPFALLGYWGLYLLPFASALLMLKAVAGLCALAGGGLRARQGAVLIAGLGTPVWFYGVAFWEHCVAACLCLWALLFLARFVDAGATRDLVRAAVLVSLAVYLRDDLYLLCALLGLTAASARSGDRLRTALRCGGAMAACLAPLWIWQWQVMGSPLGQHLSAHLFSSEGIQGHLLDRPKVFYNQLVASSPAPIISIFLSAPFLYAWLRRPRFGDSRFRTALPLYGAAATVSALISLGGYFLWDSHLSYLLASSNGLFAAAPLAILAFPRCGDGKTGSWLALLVTAYALLYAAAAPGLGSSGLHWGNRFLLILYPVWSLLAAVNLEQWGRRGGGGWRSWRLWSLAAVIALSVGAQLFSVELLRRKKEFSHRLNGIVAARPEQVVVTSERWAGHELHRVFYDKPVFHLANPRAMDALRQKLKQAGYDRYLYLTRRQRVVGPRPVGEIRDGGLNWYGMRAFSGARRRRSDSRKRTGAVPPTESNPHCGEPEETTCPSADSPAAATATWSGSASSPETAATPGTSGARR